MKNDVFYTTKDINETKIAILADIHYSPVFNEKVFMKVKKQIDEEKPKYLIIAGDLLDYPSSPFEGFIDFINNLDSNIIKIMVLGNHDLYYEVIDGKKVDRRNNVFLKRIKELPNVYLLNDEKIIMDNICFYGFELSYTHYKFDKERYSSFCNEVKKLNTSLEDNTYNITIVHSPANIYKYIEKNPSSNLAKSNLIISGHMHNGILPSWFANLIDLLYLPIRACFLNMLKEWFINQ